MFGIRGWEWIIILVVVLLIFGPSKLPGLARSVGRSISEFRGGIKQAQDEITKMAKDDLETTKTEGKPDPEHTNVEKDPQDDIDEGP